MVKEKCHFLKIWLKTDAKHPSNPCIVYPQVNGNAPEEDRNGHQQQQSKSVGFHGCQYQTTHRNAYDDGGEKHQ
jgi:hypothetical protein